MTAQAVLALYDGLILLKTADVAASLTMEALRAIPAPLDEKVHALRPHGARLWWRPICAGCWRAAAWCTAGNTIASRMPTRCAVYPRCTAPPGCLQLR